MNYPAEEMNNYGSSLIYGLFTGCAAGDTGASMVVKAG